jgi:hypothetical protein
LKIVLPESAGIQFPGGYCTRACPAGGDCGPSGTTGDFTVGSDHECWCQRTCSRAADCGRSDFAYGCCRSSPLPDAGPPPPGACNPPSFVEPDVCN